jgi:tight adherence protein B
MPSPAGDELRRVAEEHALGRPIEDAFLALSRRLPGCDAVRTLVTSILVLRQTGGNLVEVIERIIETLAAQAQYRMRLRAVTSEGRSSGVMLAALPIVFALLAAGADPAYMHLFVEDSAGQTIALITFALWASGSLWIRRLIKETA